MKKAFHPVNHVAIPRQTNPRHHALSTQLNGYRRLAVRVRSRTTGHQLCVLAMIDAALGHKDEALEEGRRAIALTPLEKDVANGSLVLQYFAITAAWAGEKELALQQLETGLHAPVASVALSYGVLKLMPFWDPLRGDPRFEKSSRRSRRSNLFIL